MPAAMIEIKDWLNFRLTGRLATDSVAYARIQPTTGGAPDVAEVLARLGFPASAVPAPMAPATPLGQVQACEDPRLRKTAGCPFAHCSFPPLCPPSGPDAHHKRVPNEKF